jgi:hypothetical protein
MEDGHSGLPWKYVFTEHRTVFGRFAFNSLHRIIKITSDRIYVDRSAEYPLGWRGFGVRMVFTLNRQELEQEGRAWCRSQRRYYYVVETDSLDDLGDDSPPSFIEKLGLAVPFTIEDVHNAYRQKAKQFHPDHGGSLEEFLALQKTYENALAFFRRA